MLVTKHRRNSAFALVRATSEVHGRSKHANKLELNTKLTPQSRRKASLNFFGGTRLVLLYGRAFTHLGIRPVKARIQQSFRELWPISPKALNTTECNTGCTWEKVMGLHNIKLSNLATGKAAAFD